MHYTVLWMGQKKQLIMPLLRASFYLLPLIPYLTYDTTYRFSPVFSDGVTVSGV